MHMPLTLLFVNQVYFSWKTERILTMTSKEQTREIVRTYHNAWMAGDIAKAGTQVADTISNPTPTNHWSKKPMPRADYLAGLAQFQPVVTGYTMISEVYDEDKAILVYDLNTSLPVDDAPTCEAFEITNGKISGIVLIFDATQFNALPRP
jgi:hypothetical protein